MTMLYRNMTHRMMDHEINLQLYWVMDCATLIHSLSIVPNIHSNHSVFSRERELPIQWNRPDALIVDKSGRVVNVFPSKETVEFTISLRN